jgi:hypothetical protein
MAIDPPPTIPNRYENPLVFVQQMDEYFTWFSTAAAAIAATAVAVGPGLFLAGSVTSPGISFDADPDCGVWRISANAIGFGTGGVEAYRINANQETLFGAGGFGYFTGVGIGGAIGQGTSRNTAVTLDKLAGDITIFSAAGSTTPFVFTVNNTKIGANDQVVISQKSGTNQYATFVTKKAAGSFQVTAWAAVGTAVDAPVFHFDIYRSTIN